MKQSSSKGGRFIRSTFSRENFEAFIIAIVLALFIRTFVVQAFKIPSGSMEPTLLIGDHILVNKFIYGLSVPFSDKKFFQFNQPERGDVIVFIYPLDPGKDFIKRVIGVSGDTVRITEKKIFINGRPFNDEHGFYSDGSIIHAAGMAGNRDNFGPVTVPSGSLFVMGDNRDKSYDSRFWGFVDVDKVKGKAFIVYWSWERPFKNIRWSRMGTMIR